MHMHTRCLAYRVGFRILLCGMLGLWLAVLVGLTLDFLELYLDSIFPELDGR